MTSLYENQGSGTKYPAAEFTNVGDKLTGFVVESVNREVQGKFRSKPVETNIVAIDPGDGNPQSVFFAADKQIATAMATAINEAGLPLSDGVKVGDKVRVTLSELRPTDKGNPMKVFTVEIKRENAAPAAAAADDDEEPF